MKDRRNSVFPSLCMVAIVGFAALPALAQVTISTRTGLAQVRTERTCGFMARHADGVRRAWVWSMDEPDGGRFISSQGRPAIQYMAPLVLTPRSFHIRATDPASGVSGVFTLQVLPFPVPDRTGKVLDTVLQKQLQGPRSTTAEGQGPVVSPFLGFLPGNALPTHAEANEQDFAWLGFRRVMDPDPGMRAVDGRWLAWNSRNELCLLAGPGQAIPIPLHGNLVAGLAWPPPSARPPLLIEDLSVLPEGAAPGDGRHMVILLNLVQSGNSGRCLCALEPDGNLRPLAGRIAPWAELPPGPHEGPGPDVVFGVVSSIALDREGNVLVVEREGVIRRVSVTGAVTILAGSFPPASAPYARREPQDGRGPAAVFGELGACALDPDTGDLYVVDGGQRIRRVSPDGTVATVLGGAYAGRSPWPEKPAMPARIEEGVYCLSRASGLDFDAGILYIADGTHDLLAFNPRDRFLYPVLRGTALHQTPRFGPLPAFAGHTPAAECASFDAYSKVAVRGGVGLVAVTNRFGPERNWPLSGVVRFELPWGAFGGRPPKAREGKAEAPRPAPAALEGKAEAGPARSAAAPGRAERQPAPPHIIVRPGATVPAGCVCSLAVEPEPAGGLPKAHWQWQTDGGLLTGSGASAILIAPAAPATLRVQVWDANHPHAPRGECAITVAAP